MDISVSKKKDQFLEILQETQLNRIFEFRMTDNDVVFRSIHSMNESVPSQILFRMDGTIYNDCMVTFGVLADESKRNDALNIMNKLNSYNRVCKYCLSEDNDLYFTFVYVCEPEKFDANVFLKVGVQLYKDFIENHYSDFNDVIQK